MMNLQTEAAYRYQCEACRHRFDVVMTFHELDPKQAQALSEQTTTEGYPEQQPECPVCRSHEVERVEIRRSIPPHGAIAMSTLAHPTIQTTIGELVTQRPSRSRIFEKLGLDYCCGGKKPLAQACAAKGLDAHTVLITLLEAEGSTADDQGTDWSQASLTALANHIEQTHHAYLKRELPRLSVMVRKVAAVHGDRYPWMFEVDGIYAGFAGEMESHLMVEEQVLFPMIRGLEREGAEGLEADAEPAPSVVDSIHAMEHEHEDAGQALERMRKLSDGFTPPPGACNTFRATLDGLRELEADTHRHVHKENSILFPRAIATEQQNVTPPHAPKGT